MLTRQPFCNTLGQRLHSDRRKMSDISKNGRKGRNLTIGSKAMFGGMEDNQTEGLRGKHMIKLDKF